MDQTYQTFDDHVELLSEKGYLDPNFKTPTQLGYWLREFQEAFDDCFRIAWMEQGDANFMMPLSGKFNNNLVTVNFHFRYKYDYPQDKLTLISLLAESAGRRKTYYITDPEELVQPQEVYECLSKPDLEKDNIPLFIRLYFEFQRDRNPENDLDTDPDTDQAPRRKLDINDYIPPSIKIGLPESLKSKFPQVKIRR